MGEEQLSYESQSTLDRVGDPKSLVNRARSPLTRDDGGEGPLPSVLADIVLPLLIDIHRMFADFQSQDRKSKKEATAGAKFFDFSEPRLDFQRKHGRVRLCGGF